jgi:UDP-N-acetyl-D-galactosamine dehydrogenase
MTIKALNDVGKVIKGSKVLIMGLTYKENVVDIRETPAKEIVRELQEYGVDIYGYDPLLSDIEQEFGIRPYPMSPITRRSSPITPLDCVILAVAHDAFKDVTLDNLRSIMDDRPILIDVRRVFEPARARSNGFYYRTL